MEGRVTRLTRHLRRRTCFRGRSRGRRTAVLVDLEPNHDRQNCGGLVRAQVGSPQGFLSTEPVAKAEADAVRYSLCLPGRISHSVYHPKCLSLKLFPFLRRLLVLLSAWVRRRLQSRQSAWIAHPQKWKQFE